MSVEKTKTESGGFYLFAVLFFLLAVTFLPLALGRNFLPFEKYPYWSSMLATSSGQKIIEDSPAFKRIRAMPGAEDPEVGSIGINWAENFYFARMLKQGRLPLWDPYTGGGVPILDGGQSRPFNPFRLPFYLFPSNWVYSLTLFAGLLFGGIGAYLWISKSHVSKPAVILGTGLFILNPWVLDRLVLTDSSAYFVLPWCLIALTKATWKSWPGVARAVLSFVLMGCCGHPEVSIIMACVVTTVYFTHRNQGEKDESFLSKLKTVGGVATLTLASLTVLWLPFLRLLRIGYIYKQHASFIYEYDWKTLVLLPSDMFVAPAVSAILAAAFLNWKRVPKAWVFWICIATVFLFPLPWAGSGLSRALTSLGLPSLYLKGVFWASVSFLVPFGLDAFIASRKTAALAAWVVGAAMFTVSGLLIITFPAAQRDLSAFPISSLLLLGLGLLALAVFRVRRETIPAWLLSAMLLVPFAFPLSLNKLLWNSLDFKTNSVVEWLKTNRPEARSISVDPRLTFAIPPNLGQAYGVRCAEVSAAIFLNNYWSMFHHPRALPTAVFFDFYSAEVFKQMGASVVLLPNEASAAGLDLLVKGRSFSAYSIPGAHGRLYFAEQIAEYRPGTPFPQQISSLGQGADVVAIVEGMGTPFPPVLPVFSSEKSQAVFERDDVDEIVVRARSSSEALMVLRDSWFPDWIAFINEKRVPVLRINGCFRGVVVPAGEHLITFKYRPIVTYVSGAVSLLALILVVCLAMRRDLTQGSG